MFLSTRPHSRNRRLFLVAASVVSLLFVLLTAACEDVASEGDISDDALNGRNNNTETTTDNSSNTSNNTDNSNSQNNTQPDTPSNPTTPDNPDEPDNSSDAVNTSTEISGIHWKGKDISGWPVTTTLRAAVSGGNVHLYYNKAYSWPVVDGVCGNLWAIVNINGQWYAGTCEYLRQGQTSKGSYCLDGSQGDHFKTSPLSSWRPRSGEVFGLMVSGLCRGGLSNVKERSNICIVRWP